MKCYPEEKTDRKSSFWGARRGFLGWEKQKVWKIEEEGRPFISPPISLAKNWLLCCYNSFNDPGPIATISLPYYRHD